MRKRGQNTFRDFWLGRDKNLKRLRGRGEGSSKKDKQDKA
jgi:hypothetical protein